MMKTLSDVVGRLEAMAARPWRQHIWKQHTKELREVATFLSDEGGLKAMQQTLECLAPQGGMLGRSRIPLLSAQRAIGMSRRRTAEVEAQGPELSRLRVRVRVLERKLRETQPEQSAVSPAAVKLWDLSHTLVPPGGIFECYGNPVTEGQLAKVLGAIGDAIQTASKDGK